MKGQTLELPVERKMLIMKMMKGQTLELPVQRRDANSENDERIDTRITGRKKRY